MGTHSFFISHSSATKELARHIYYNAIANGQSPWYDEGLLEFGDDIDQELANGINASDCFLLLHCEKAMEKRWVTFEMQIAKEKHEKDNSFRIIVVKLDNYPLNDVFWNKFLYHSWNYSDEPGSILKLLETIIGRKGIVSITASSVLTSSPSEIYVNQAATLAEHTRNFVLWYLSQIKQSLHAASTVGYEQELRDTISKLLNLSLFQNIPMLQGGMIPVEPGLIEFIHANRMRIPPKINIQGLPNRYSWEEAEINEVFSRIRIIDNNTKEQVKHPVPLSITVEFNTEL